MKCLVTGGTGCLGTALVKSLLEAGSVVRVLAVDAAEGDTLDGGRCSAIRGSITDSDAALAACRDIDVVFHLAAAVHADRMGPPTAGGAHEINVGGTKTMLSAARAAGVRRFVFFSTVGVYGLSSGVVSDDTPLAPRTPYTISKRLAEIEVSTSGIPYTILRFPVAYGARDRGNVARLIKAVSNRRFAWTKRGAIVRSMVAAGNAAHAAILASSCPAAEGRTFLVSDGQPHSLSSVVKAITAALGSDWSPFDVPDALLRAMAVLGDRIKAVPLNSETYTKLFRSYEIRSNCAADVLGYSAAQSLRSGIADEVAWLKKTGQL
jgi:UDP-glucose 4-epimerase